MAAQTMQNKSEPNDTDKHQKQELEKDQNPKHSAKLRQREEKRGEGEGKSEAKWGLIRSAREFQTFFRRGRISRAEQLSSR